MAGELGRVENHRVEGFAGRRQAFERREGVGLFEVDVGRDAVELGIGPRQGERRLGRVDGMHRARPAVLEGGNAESTRVAEQIEHAVAGHIAGGRQTVLALVEVEARLVSLRDVDPKPQPVFDDEQRPRRLDSAGQAVGQFKPLALAHPLFRPQPDALAA